ncbi:MAG: RNA 2',3'-cyclic phosphodiesterase [Phycisphaerae bacterium]|nr:RNA 2',3'-cyclic phosphodiesterase [Phycisphaerae bacterium]
MSLRAFLALPLDEVIVERLVEVQRSLASAGARVRWVGAENLHLTIKFLGDVADEQLPDVCRAAEEVSAQIEPFEFSVASVISVPPAVRLRSRQAGAMRMVWVGVDEPAGRLERLHELLEESYADMGFPKENRSFRPHLTLGRVKSGRNVRELRQAVDEIAETAFGIASVNEVIVFSSQLTPDGPVYSPLAKVKLGRN